MSIFTKLFSGKKPDVARWREIQDENAKDLKAAGYWLTGDPHDQIASMLEKLAVDPFNLELGDQVIALAAKFESERAIRTRIAAIVFPTIEKRIAVRTKAAAKDVFEAALAKLRAELVIVEDADAKQAQKYGLDPKPSHIAEQLRQEISRLESHLSIVDTERAQDVSTWVENLLGK
jgi:hypothetical protein